MTKEDLHKICECGQGWFLLLDPIYDFIEWYNSTHKEHIEFLQIKEKFGGLRVYTNFSVKDLDELIEEAEDRSFHTCEICGSTENVTTKPNRKGGWILTLCDKCRQQT